MDPDDNETRWVLAGAALLTQDIFITLGHSGGLDRGTLVGEGRVRVRWGRVV